MKSRTLILLAAVLAVLGIASLFANRSGRSPSGETKAEKQPLLPIGDLAQVAQIGIASGTQSVELARTSNGWTIASMWGYPADSDRVADDLLNKYRTTKLGEARRDGLEHLAEYGLDPAAKDAAATKPVLVTFRDEKGKTLSVVSVGADHQPPSRPGMQGGYPDAQFVRVDNGPVAMTADFIGRPGVRGMDWIQTSLPPVDAEQVVEVDLTDISGRSYGASKDTNGQFVAHGNASNEQVKVDAASALFGSLSYLSFSDVAGPVATAGGLLSASNCQFRARTRDGRVYSFVIGPETKAGLRPVRAGVSFARPPAPAPVPASTNAPVMDPLKTYEAACAQTQKTVDEENAKRGNWIYLMDLNTTMNLAMPRDQFFSVPAPATNAPVVPK